MLDCVRFGVILGAAALGCFGASLSLQLTPQTTVEQRLESGAVDAKKRQNQARKLFETVGCQVQPQKVSSAANLICDLPGSSASTIIVGGHFDFAERGQGIVDDWSGTALLSSLYETLHGENRKHTFRFIAFASEEQGLVGSTRFVKSLSGEERGGIQAFVNLECLGVSTPRVWVHRSDPALTSDLILVARATHVELSGVNVDAAGDDDTHPFVSKKIPVVTIHSLTPDNFRIIHSDRDEIGAVNRQNYYDAYRLIAYYLAYLDGKLP